MGMILTLTIIGAVLVTLGLLGLYADVSRRLRKIERELNSHKTEITDHKREIRIIKERAAQESDKVVIVHEYPSNDIKFKGEGI